MSDEERLADAAELCARARAMLTKRDRMRLRLLLDMVLIEFDDISKAMKQDEDAHLPPSSQGPSSKH